MSTLRKLDSHVDYLAKTNRIARFVSVLEWAGYQWRKLTRQRLVLISGVRIEVTSALPKGVRRALYRGDYESAERQLVTEFLKPNDRVLEVGSGIGLIAITCANVVTQGKVLSYEANPVLAGQLKRNIELNGADIEVHNRAVSDVAGILPFHVHDRFVSSSLIKRPGSRRIDVQCDALTDVIVKFEPTAIVMDIEGAETEILPTADLSCVRALIVELHPHISTREELSGLVDILGEKGFNVEARMDDVYVFLRLNVAA